MRGYFGNQPASALSKWKGGLVYQDEQLVLWDVPGVLPTGSFHGSDGSQTWFFGRLREGPAQPKDAARQIHELFGKPDRREAFAGLNGSFFVIHYRPAASDLFLLSDRCGSQKVFYGFRDGAFYFFPHVADFLPFGFCGGIDLTMAAAFAAICYFPGDWTPLRGVRQMPQGALLRIRGEEVVQDDYWTFSFPGERPQGRGFDEAAGEMGGVWCRSVERSLRGAARIVVPISGGLDSRAILAAVLESRSASDIHTVTYGVPGTLDFELGRVVADAAGTRHHEIDLARVDDPFEEYRRQCEDSDGVADIVNQVFPSHWSKVFDIAPDIVIGLMGGWLAGGGVKKYRFRDLYAPVAEDPPFPHLVERHRTSGLKAVGALAGEPREEAAARVEEALGHGARRNHHGFLSGFCEQWDFENRQAKFTSTHLLKRRLHAAYRFPFLDSEFLDFLRGLPMEWREGQKLYRAMLLKEFPRLYKLPTKNELALPLQPSGWQKTRRALKKHLVERFSRRDKRSREKHFKLLNYLDIRELLRSDESYREEFSRCLEDLAGRGLFQPDAIRSVWKDHLQRRENQENLISNLYSLELILSRFGG